MHDDGIRASLDETERWFLRRGLPHFIADYRAARDIWTRALPALTLLFVLESVQAVNLEEGWSWWQNTLAIAGGFAILLGGWALVNRLRGRRALTRPDDLSGWEVAAFVVLPAVVPLVFGGQEGTALLTVVANSALLAVIYFGTSYAIVPLTRWGLGHLGRQVGTFANLVVRALPLLLLFVTFLFVNTEVWQVATSLTWPAVGLSVGLFVSVGVAFALIRLPRQIGELAEPEPWERVVERVADTPAAALLPGVEPVERAPLTRRQWGNVGLVVLVSEGTQIVLVTAGIFVFFVLFGFLAVGPGVLESWLGHAPADPIATLDLWGQRMVLSDELLHVATFLAVFSGLYFTVVLLTDATYREEFLDDLVDQVHRSFAVRRVYLAALAAGGTAAPAEPSSTISST